VKHVRNTAHRASRMIPHSITQQDPSTSLNINTQYQLSLLQLSSRAHKIFMYENLKNHIIHKKREKPKIHEKHDNTNEKTLKVDGASVFIPFTD
jgi:hypothetical protein